MQNPKFITYFDYLGFGDFILNNDLEYQRRVMGAIFVEIESALAKGKLVASERGYSSDLSVSKVNCINFSDTVVFWTNDLSPESVKELLSITYTFNWRSNLNFFPVRGAMTIGEIESIIHSHTSALGGTYNINSVYGKGIVTAHGLAESQKWAGTILCENVERFVLDNFDDGEAILDSYSKQFPVPFKSGNINKRAFHLIDGLLNNEAFENFSKSIEGNFEAHNKRVDSSDVQEKLTNTITFLSSYRQ
jgi:hypothetical protein